MVFEDLLHHNISHGEQTFSLSNIVQYSLAPYKNNYSLEEFCHICIHIGGDLAQSNVEISFRHSIQSVEPNNTLWYHASRFT